MKFKRYNSIENSYSSRFIDKIVDSGFDKEIFSVKEKVNGANFSFHLTKKDGEIEIKCAKRSSFLKENDFNRDLILNKNKEKLEKIFEIVEKSGKEFIQLSVYGESLGGCYNHPDIKKVKDVKKIQSGVFYTPDAAFFAFDLLLDGKYLPTNTADRVFKESGILYLENIFEGSLQDCLDFNIDFDSRIPKKLGMPEPGQELNRVEGIVIKPQNKVLFIHDGSRVIIKKKSPKFLEKKQSKKSTPIIPEDILSIIKEAELYCTKQRLNNMISKEGEISFKSFGNFMKKLNIDVMENFSKDFPEYLKKDKKDKTIINKKIGSINAKLIREYLKEGKSND